MERAKEEIDGKAHMNPREWGHLLLGATHIIAHKQLDKLASDSLTSISSMQMIDEEKPQLKKDGGEEQPLDFTKVLPKMKEAEVINTRKNYEEGVQPWQKSSYSKKTAGRDSVRFALRPQRTPKRGSVAMHRQATQQCSPSTKGCCTPGAR